MAYVGPYRPDLGELLVLHRAACCADEGRIVDVADHPQQQPTPSSLGVIFLESLRESGPRHLHSSPMQLLRDGPGRIPAAPEFQHEPLPLDDETEHSQRIGRLTRGRRPRRCERQILGDFVDPALARVRIQRSHDIVCVQDVLGGPDADGRVVWKSILNEQAHDGMKSEAVGIIEPFRETDIDQEVCGAIEWPQHHRARASALERQPQSRARHDC